MVDDMYLQTSKPTHQRVNWVDSCKVCEPLLGSHRIKKLDVKPLSLSTGNRVSHAVLLREDLPRAEARVESSDLRIFPCG